MGLLAVVYLYMLHVAPPVILAPGTLHVICSLNLSVASSLAALRLGLLGAVHVFNFRQEFGGEDVDLLVGAVQQAECSDLVGGGRVVFGCLEFLTAVCGLKS